MTLAQYIRAQFPHPVIGIRAANTENPACYCVGGAALLYKRRLKLHTAGTSDWQRFPDPAELASVIGDYQPFVPKDVRLKLAIDIIAHNDDGEFDKAWAVLETALTGCVDHP